MGFILALDQGTTSSRAVVFDDRGRIRSVGRREHRQIYPRPGWVEHDVEELWQGQLLAAREALTLAGIDGRKLVAIGITNQRETTVLWDRRTGRPLHNAIVWQDRRTADTCDRLVHDGHGERIRQVTGLVPDPYFSATKLSWLLDHVPDARARARRGELAFGTIDSFLIYRLTRGHVHATDPSNASRTMLLRLDKLQWDDEMLGLFDVPRKVLPELVDSSGELGVAAAAWFGADVPIFGVAGDQQAALFGHACFEPGLTKCTYGTGCFVLTQLGKKRGPKTGKLLSTVAWRLPGQPPQHAVEGSVFAGGSVVQWLRDGLGIIRSSAEVEPLAASVPNSDGVCLVPAFTGLGAPHWDPHARGVITGLTRGVRAAHIARAALDSIAHQVADVCAAVSDAAAVDVHEVRVDGGACKNDLLMQIQADLLGVPVVRPKVIETTALGAAYLAGLGAGVWSAPEDLLASREVDRVFGPTISRDEATARTNVWRDAVWRTLATRPAHNRAR